MIRARHAVAPARLKPVAQTTRRDGMTRLGRLGSTSVSSQYPLELRIGDPAAEELLEAALRGTWMAADTIDESDGSLGAITIASNVVTSAGGTWAANGLRVGQVVRFTGLTATGDNGVWQRVIDVDGQELTVADTPGLTDSVSDNEWDLEIARHLYQGNPPVERYFTVEEHLQDVDESIVAEDMKVNGLTFSVSADNHIVLTFPWLGRQMKTVSGASAPYFTAPTFGTGDGLVLLDGLVRVNGEDVAELTDLTFSLNPNASTLPILGSRVSPDVFMDNAVGEGSISGALLGLDNLTALLGEANLEIFLIAHPRGDSSEFISFYMGNVAYRGHSKPFGGSGAMIESMPIAYGVDDRPGRLPSMLVISTSAAGV